MNQNSDAYSAFNEIPKWKLLKHVGLKLPMQGRAFPYIVGSAAPGEISDAAWAFLQTNGSWTYDREGWNDLKFTPNWVLSELPYCPPWPPMDELTDKQRKHFEGSSK